MGVQGSAWILMSFACPMMYRKLLGFMSLFVSPCAETYDGGIVGRYFLLVESSPHGSAIFLSQISVKVEV